MICRGGDMKQTLMTFNLLNAWTPGSPVYKTMRARSVDAAQFVKKVLPDILCFQELDYYYRHDGELLRLIADEYAEADTQDELVGKGWNAIFYRRDRFSVIESGGYNFTANGFSVVPIKPVEGEELPSKACNCHNYRYPENSEEGRGGITKTRFRSLGWALLESEGERVIVATTHFSLRLVCQAEETAFVLEKLKELKERYGCRIILCGDFNSNCETRNSAAAGLLEKGFFDTYDMAGEKDDRASCHQSSGKGEGSGEVDKMPGGSYKPHAIDHIFTDSPMAVDTYRIYAEPELLAVSDHCPTMITFDNH